MPVDPLRIPPTYPGSVTAVVGVFLGCVAGLEAAVLGGVVGLFVGKTVESLYRTVPDG